MSQEKNTWRGDVWGCRWLVLGVAGGADLGARAFLAPGARLAPRRPRIQDSNATPHLVF